MSYQSIVPNILSASVLDFPGGVANYNKTLALTVVSVAEQLMMTHGVSPEVALNRSEAFMRQAEKYVREFKGVQESGLL